MFLRFAGGGIGHRSTRSAIARIARSRQSTQQYHGTRIQSDESSEEHQYPENHSGDDTDEESVSSEDDDIDVGDAMTQDRPDDLDEDLDLMNAEGYSQL
jgi:hypothetical protein